MSISLSELSKIASSLNKRLQGEHLAHICLYAEDTISFHTSIGEKLVLSLDNRFPYVYLSSTLIEAPTLSSSFASVMRKEFGNALVKKVSLLNDDRVIDFECEVINEVFKAEEIHLYAELIPSKANLVLVNDECVVVSALRTNSLSDARPLFPGIKYEAPLKGGFGGIGEDVPLDFEGYCRAMEEREDALFERRKKQKYHDLYRYAANRVKGAKRKIAAIEDDIVKAKEHLNDGDYGNFIYMNMDDIDPQSGSMDYYGETVALDPSRNKAQNAEMFFKRQKKAKATYRLGEENLNKANKEYREAIMLNEMVKTASEEGLSAIESELGLAKRSVKSKPKSKKEGKLVSRDSLPYFVIDEGTTYAFGKTANQNDFLSFVYATSKKHTWMHLMGHTGAHLVIRKDEATEDEIALGAELLCLCSNLEQGEAMVALRKDVRKGSVPGQAIVNKYKTIRVNSIDKKAKDLFALAKKIEY